MVSNCVLDKKDIKEACDKIGINEMEKYFLQAQLEMSGVIEFYIRLQKEMTKLNEIRPEDFVTIAFNVINDLRDEISELSLSITYVNAKYAGIYPIIPVIAGIIFPPNFHSEVEDVLNNL